MFRLHMYVIIRLVFRPVKRLAKGLILGSARGSRAVFWRLAKNKNNNAQQAADRRPPAARSPAKACFGLASGCWLLRFAATRLQMLTRFFILSLLIAPLSQALGQITKPTDAPNPLTPAESLKTVRLPDGFRLELVAAEPLIRQPSGVCWDAEGNLFVAELHGYNREGQFDIEELN